VSLLADIRLGDPDPKTAISAVSSGIVRVVNADPTSALSRRFAVPGIPPEPQQNLTISEAVNGLTRSGLVGHVASGKFVPGPLCDATDDDTIKRAQSVLNIYFEKLRTCNPARWEAGKAAYIAVNPGIRAHFMLIGEVVRYLEHKRGFDFHELPPSKFADYVVDVVKPAFDYIGTASDESIKARFGRKFGEGGVREYLFELYRLIHEARDDFGPEDFLKWVGQQESEKIEEANSLVMKISEKMIDCVVGTLKAIHGTKRMPSGDEVFWEKGIESRRVKENAFKKQQEDSAERRRPKEAYLDLIDLREIMKQPNNWDHFAPIFNVPMPGEKKGNKFYLSWMDQFNDLRRIAAHKSSLRTYSDEDLEFLDKLRTELLPRLETEPGVIRPTRAAAE
jgi:DNA sulfur modification protein DndB